MIKLYANITITFIIILSFNCAGDFSSDYSESNSNISSSEKFLNTRSSPVRNKIIITERKPFSKSGTKKEYPDIIYNRLKQADLPKIEFMIKNIDDTIACLLKENGTIICFNKDYKVRFTFEEKYLDIATFFYNNDSFLCGIKAIDYTVDCWDHQLIDVSESVFSNTKMTKIAAYDNHICGIKKSDSSIFCRSLSNNWADYAHMTQAPYIDVAVGFNQICGISKLDDRVDCELVDPDIDEGQANPPSYKFKKLSAGLFYTCGIKDDDTVACWGTTYEGMLDPPMDEYSDLNSRGYLTCGITLSNNLKCWGYQDYNSEEESYGVYDDIKLFSFWEQNSCQIKKNGNVSCNSASNSLSPFKTLPEHSILSVGDQHFCKLTPDGSVECEGSNAQHQSTPTELTSNKFYLSADSGAYHTCGIQSDNELECWGSNSNGQASPPDGKFLLASSGFLHTCGLKFDHSVECWGYNLNNQLEVPELSSGEYFIYISSGGFHTCGTVASSEWQNSQKMVCWGDNNYNQLNAPTEYHHYYSDLSSGHLHTCAIRNDEEQVICWGNNQYGQLNEQSWLTNEYRKLSVGGWHSCGLVEHFYLCWGRDDYDQSVFGSVTNFETIQIEAGLYDTCVLLRSANGSEIIQCDGKNLSGYY